jgi:hypothetical protein
MPRKRIEDPIVLNAGDNDLAKTLASELRSAREAGQPTIYEQEYATGKMRVTVIWDAWVDAPLEERSAIILKAYESAEGPAYREKVALASGFTVSEAHAAGILPFQIIPALRQGDPVTREQAQQAFLEEGASKLVDPKSPQLRFATEAEAEASRRRLIERFPGSDDVWIINREITARDPGMVLDQA